MFLEWDNQQRLEVLDSFLAQNNKVWPEQETYNQISIIDMDLKLFVQSNEDETLSIYMKYTNSDVKYELLEDIYKYLIHKNNKHKYLPNLYQRLELQDKVTLNWRVHHHLDSVCAVCFQDMKDDPDHSEI